MNEDEYHGERKEEFIEEMASNDFDFNKVFDELDGRMQDDGNDAFRRLCDSFRQNLTWVWVSNTGRQRNLKSSFLRFVALTALLFPEAFQNKSYASIGKAMGVRKQWVSQMTIEIENRYGVKFARSYNRKRK